MRNASGNVANTPPPAPLSRQKAELKKAFGCAKNIDKMLKVFKGMEASFDESDLAFECLTIADKLLTESHDFDVEEGLRFGRRALRILLTNLDNNKPIFIDKYNVHNICTNCRTPSYFITRVCNLLGSASFDLKRYDESISYLDWAIRNFTKLEKDYSSCRRNCVRLGLLNTEFLLYQVNVAKGKLGEAALHGKNILEVKERFLEEGSIILGEANMDVFEAYCAAEDFKAALPFGLKALEIHEKHLGHNSDVVAQIMSRLAFVYQVLGEYEKGFEQSQLSLSVLKNTGSSSYSLLMDSGKYEEAIDVLEGMVSRDDIKVEERISVLITLAKAFVKLGKFTDAKKRIRSLKNILEKKGTNPVLVATGFGGLSRLYEELNDPETALTYIRRAAAIPDVPQPHLRQNASRLFSLTLKSRKVKEGIPYLEDMVKKLKDSFGSEHYEIGIGYVQLGYSYWSSGQQELGVKFMENAKDIMDAALGPNNIASLRASQTLSKTYESMGRYREAINIQEKVVKCSKGLGEQKFMDEAITHLKGMKEGAAKSPTSTSPQVNDGENLCETIAKCGISDDGTPAWPTGHHMPVNPAQPAPVNSRKGSSRKRGSNKGGK